jgi:uncharacterized iron-regulated membrane protein
VALLRQLHAWAGLVLCLVLAVIALSGTLLVFKADWLALVEPAARTEAPIDLAAMARLTEAAQALPQSRDGPPQALLFGEPGMALSRVYFPDKTEAYLAPDGSLIDQFAAHDRPEGFLFQLHHYLLAGDVGALVAGSIGIAACVMVVTGLVLWWPARRSFGLQLWPAGTARRDWLRFHRDAGVVFALPVLVFAISGASMVFDSQTRAVLKALVPSAQTDRPAAKPPTVTPGPVDLDWQSALMAAQATYPSATIRLVIWPRRPDAPVTLRLRQPGEWHPNGRTMIWLHPRSGKVLGTVDALALPRAERWFNGFYPLHASFVGGRLVDAISAMSGLMLAALSLAGAWSFVLRLRRQRTIQLKPG